MFVLPTLQKHKQENGGVIQLENDPQAAEKVTEEKTLMLMQRWSVSDSLPGQTLAAADRGGKAPGVGKGQRTGESRCKHPGRDSRNVDRTWTLALTRL